MVVVVGVVPTKFHPNRIKIAKVCFLGGFWVGWLEWAKHTPRYVAYLFTIIQPKLDLPTKLHPNWARITKVWYWGGFGVGGVGQA